MGILIGIVCNAVALYVTTLVVPGIAFTGSLPMLLLAGLILGLFNQKPAIDAYFDLVDTASPVIDRPEELLRGYLEHRREREQQIVDAMLAGDTDPDAITARVYRGIKAELLPMAREGVVAHLVKLEREHRVRREAERWTMIGS